VIKGPAVALSLDASGKAQKKEQTLTAIPYYAWANRGRGEMAVWLARDEKHAKPDSLDEEQSHDIGTKAAQSHQRRGRAIEFRRPFVLL
jgi:hypothetical protein